MTDVITDHADAIGASGRSSFTAPPPDTEDNARHIGEILRRLAQAAKTFPPQAYARIVVAVLVALGKAVLIEADATPTARRSAELDSAIADGLRSILRQRKALERIRDGKAFKDMAVRIEPILGTAIERLVEDYG